MQNHDRFLFTWAERYQPFRKRTDPVSHNLPSDSDSDSDSDSEASEIPSPYNHPGVDPNVVAGLLVFAFGYLAALAYLLHSNDTTLPCVD